MSTISKPILPPPPSRKHWLLGDVPELRRNMLKWMLDRHEELGPIFSTRILDKKIIVTSEPDYVKHIMQDNNRKYRLGFGNDVLKMFMGEGLFVSEGDFWLRQRRLAQPAFHKERLEIMAGVMVEEAENCAREWVAKPKDELIDVNETMMGITLRIVGRTLFSSNVEQHISTLRHNLEFLMEFSIDRVKAPVSSPMWIPTSKNQTFKRMVAEVDEILYGIIDRREQQPGKYDDLLAMFMEARDEDTGEQMTRLQLRDECMTFILAGHETTAQTLTWAIDMVARHPEVQNQLQEEVQTVLGNRAPTTEDLRSLQYTQAIIDETLRLFPPGWVFGRQAIEDDQVGKFLIPQNTDIFLVPFITQRRPDLWERAEEFWPGRWETEAVKNRHRYSYFPFSAGPRLCMGNQFALMEMAIVLATLARDMRFVNVFKEHPGFNPHVALRSENPIRVRVQPH